MLSKRDKPAEWLRKRLAQLHADKPRGAKLALAQHCGVTKQDVGAWFRTGRVGKPRLPCIASFYGVPVESLLAPSDAPGEQSVPTIHPAHATLLHAFGKHVRKIRGSRTQTEIASHLGLTSEDIAAIERGERSFDSDLLVRLAAALGEPPYVLLGGLKPQKALPTYPSMQVGYAIDEASPKRRDEIKAALASVGIALEPPREVDQAPVVHRKRRAG